ncbi:MAG: DUF2807 domain-containing protein [Planctomycetota bacterium]|nr:DUF2807 domain-containing protein [Planctomycetota bacterium]
MKTPLSITAVALAFASCSTIAGIEGSGTIQTEPRSVPTFHAIAVHGSGEMLLSQGDVATVEIECDDNLLEHIKSEVVDAKLSLGPDGVNLRPTDRIIYRVVVKDLDSIALSGSLSLQCPVLQAGDLSIRTSGSGRVRIGELKGNAVEYKVSGSGNLKLGSMTADSLKLKVSGSGKVHVGQGSASKLDVGISGSGNMDLQNLQTQEAIVRIAGSGKALLWAEESLSGGVSGSGRVEYRGSPVIDWSSSGSGKIRPIKEAEDK